MALGQVVVTDGLGGMIPAVAPQVNNVRAFGAKDDGQFDNLAVFNDAVDETPAGGAVYIPSGTFLLSAPWIITKPITILTAGYGAAGTSVVIPSADFPAGESLISVVGHSVVSGLCSNMYGRGGNWLTVLGGDCIIERNRVEGVAGGYWGIELRDPTGLHGIAHTHIDANVMSAFAGGGIWANGGGDSCTVTRNLLQLGASGGHIIKWDGRPGTACLVVAANNLTGAAKFIEFNQSTEFKFRDNQCEAGLAITNAANAMIVVNGPTFGSCIENNNLGGHSNVEAAIYFDDAQDCVVSNNSIHGTATSVRTTANTARITFIPGPTSGTPNDATGAVLTPSLVPYLGAA